MLIDQIHTHKRNKTSKLPDKDLSDEKEKSPDVKINEIKSTDRDRQQVEQNESAEKDGTPKYQSEHEVPERIESPKE